MRDVKILTVPNPANPEVPFLGIELSEPTITLPFPVKFDLGQVGGPSAGLAFALDLAEELGRDVDRGRRVAATGEIGLDGSVRAVGGIKQKTIGARQSDMDLFLVPGETPPKHGGMPETFALCLWTAINRRCRSWQLRAEAVRKQ